jgi:hypothetical protein
MMKPLGQIAFEAYRNHSGGESLVSGQALPAWPGLDERIRGAWEYAARQVIDEAATRLADLLIQGGKGGE